MEPVTRRRPIISAIMPNYNHATFLPEALDSLLAQTLQPDEIIIIDDASTDGSWAILEHYADLHPHIRLLRNEQNSGVLYTIRRLLALAQGEYFFGMASDDRILPNFLERSVALLRQYPQAGLCSSRSYIIDNNGVRQNETEIPFVSANPMYLRPNQAKSLLTYSGSWINGNATVYRLQALIDAGGYILELDSFCDGFIAQVIALRYGACFIPELLAEWRRAETGYAASLFLNHVRAFAVRDHTVRLMRTTYADVFSTAYINLWSHTYNAAFELSIWDQTTKTHHKALQNWRALRPDSKADAAFGMILRLLQFIQKLLVHGYITVYYRLVFYRAIHLLKRCLGQSVYGQVLMYLTRMR